jgi:hypothetical protein
LDKRLQIRNQERNVAAVLIRHFIAVIGIVALSACATAPQTPVATAPPFATFSSEQQAIYDAVFHHMFAYCRERKFDGRERFFLKLDGHDAPADLLQHYQQQGYDVLAGSHYRHGRGTECSVGKIERSSNSRARVYGGYLFGPVGGEWGNFQLKKEKGKWKVISWNPEMFA